MNAPTADHHLLPALRLPLVTAALRAQLSTLRPALAGHALSPCF